MKVAVYGTWDSPISAELAASSGIQFQDLVVDGDDIYWTEMRPSEAGRTAILKYSPERGVTECLTSEFSARTRVHEYGGGAFTVDKGILYFVNDKDQCLYRQAPNSVPQRLTEGGVRLANFQMTPLGLIAVAELHDDSMEEPQNYLALVDPLTGQIFQLATGYDFYSSPAVSADGTKVAWIAWLHPNMPWDNTTLWIADLTQNGFENVQKIEPDFKTQSFFQPQWDKNNQLFVVSDKSNWWNIYQVKKLHLVPYISLESELGQPMWVFGLSTWVFYQNGIVFSHTLPSGGKRLAYYSNNTLTEFELPFTGFSNIRVYQDSIICFAAAADKPPALIKVNDNGEFSIIHSSSEMAIGKDSISIPVHIEFSSKDSRRAYGYFYAPKNRGFQGPASDKPPLIVTCHGGPTGQASDEWNTGIQYWTSRGFAVVDVNYAGSTGYGRKYRQSLEGNWGLYEVQDCIAAVEYLVEKGWVAADKVAITGGSAGGLTVLSALASSNVFSAGCVRYGVTDLKSLVHDTHKFESRYLDRLIGPYPEQKTKYEARSPINYADKIHCPVIFFHGDEDKVVPLSQTEVMLEKLRSGGNLCECIVFAGEQHGFRQAKNREKMLEEQQRFLNKVFKL